MTFQLQSYQIILKLALFYKYKTDSIMEGYLLTVETNKNKKDPSQIWRKSDRVGCRYPCQVALLSPGKSVDCWKWLLGCRVRVCDDIS